MRPVLIIFAFLMAHLALADSVSLYKENGKVGLKDPSGAVLIPATYEALGWSDATLSLLDNHVLGYKLDGRWGLISTKNVRLTDALYTALLPSDGDVIIAARLSPFLQRTLYGALDATGKTVVPFAYDDLTPVSLRAIAVVRDGSRFACGLITLDNRIVIPFLYRTIRPLGSLRFAVENFRGKTALFNENGKAVSDFVIDSISSFHRDLAFIYAGDKMGLINRDGTLRLPAVYRSIRVDEGRGIQVQRPDRWTVLSLANQPLDTLEADALDTLGEDRKAIRIGSHRVLTDANWNPLGAAAFDSIGRFSHHLAIASSSSGVGVIRHDGSFLLPPVYREVLVGERYLLAQRVTPEPASWQLLDTTARPLTTRAYQRLLPPSHGLFFCEYKDHWGAVDSLGHEVISCIYDSLLQDDGARMVVRFLGKYGIITRDENWVVTPGNYPLRLLDSTHYFELHGPTWYLKTNDGELVYFSSNRFTVGDSVINEYVSDGGIWQIDFQGCILARSFPPGAGFEAIFPPSEGLRLIRRDGKFGFVDQDGALRVANRYENAQPFCGDRAAVEILHHWGFIDREEHIIVQPTFDAVQPFRGHTSIVEKGGLFGLVQDDGSELLPTRYDTIERVQGGYFILDQKGQAGLADASGNILIQCRYEEVRPPREGYVAVKILGKWGLVTLDDLPVVPPLYDDLFFDPRAKQVCVLRRATWETR